MTRTRKKYLLWAVIAGVGGAVFMPDAAWWQVAGVSFCYGVMFSFIRLSHVDEKL